MPFQPRAIETRYLGFRFRSRTEARWAVFLTALGIKFEYEREGYKLPAGKYLPDFWLEHPSGPGGAAWMEIKGDRPDHRTKILLGQLACATHTDAYLVHGLPLEHDVYYITAEGGCAHRWQGSHDFPARTVLTALATRYGVNHDLQAAVNAATAARFEWGESG